MSRRRVLLVDSYDSFTHNIAHLLASLGARVDVLAVDDLRLTPKCVREYQAIVLGPGPGTPHKGDSLTQLVALTIEVSRPLLGICLGMQAIARHFGASIVRAPRAVHGELSTIVHDGTGLFAGIASPLRAIRYHSLCIARATIPAALNANALSEDGVIQGIQGTTLPVWGLQFHPESFLSENGTALFANFLAAIEPLSRQVTSRQIARATELGFGG